MNHGRVEKPLGRASLVTIPGRHPGTPERPGRLVAGKPGRRSALVCSVALLLPGVLAVAAFAQDEPPKVEVPRAVPPPAADSQPPLEKAPQEVQKQDPVPAEKKAAPAPGDQEKPAPPAPEMTRRRLHRPVHRPKIRRRPPRRPKTPARWPRPRARRRSAKCSIWRTH